MFIIIFRVLLFYLVYLIVEKRNKYLLLFVSVIWSYSVINYNEELINYIIPTFVIIIIDYLLEFISFKMPTLIKYNKNNIIIENGRINFKNIEKYNYSIDKFIMDLKNNGVNDIDDVIYGVFDGEDLEIVLRKNKPIDIIVDGKINYKNLNIINKNKQWLNNILVSKKVRLKDVMYAFYKNDKCFVIKFD